MAHLERVGVDHVHLCAQQLSQINPQTRPVEQSGILVELDVEVVVAFLGAVGPGDRPPRAMEVALLRMAVPLIA